jgi:hypothetical protein
MYKGELPSNTICISIVLINNRIQLAGMLLLLRSSFMLNNFAEALV